MRGGRRGFAREIGFLLLIALCILLAYQVAGGDVGDMVAAFLRRVRGMGQPQ